MKIQQKKLGLNSAVQGTMILVIKYCTGLSGEACIYLLWNQKCQPWGYFEDKMTSKETFKKFARVCTMLLNQILAC